MASARRIASVIINPAVGLTQRRAHATVDQLSCGSSLLRCHRKTPAGDWSPLLLFTFYVASAIRSYAGSHVETSGSSRRPTSAKPHKPSQSMTAFAELDAQNRGRPPIEASRYRRTGWRAWGSRDIPPFQRISERRTVLTYQFKETTSRCPNRVPRGRAHPQAMSRPRRRPPSRRRR
jgi:hypothetical protein